MINRQRIEYELSVHFDITKYQPLHSKEALDAIEYIANLAWNKALDLAISETQRYNETKFVGDRIMAYKVTND